MAERICRLIKEDARIKAAFLKIVPAV